MANSKIVKFHIRRYDPRKDKEPYFKTYDVPVAPGMVVLDALHYIRENLDPTLVWRYSCRMGVCGSCGMLINGSPTLACNTQIMDVSETEITVGPLPNFRVMKDLVPELSVMFEKHRSVSPFILRKNLEEQDDPAGEFYQTPEDLEGFLQLTYCIKCGCCMAACPTLATDPDYLGPMPLAQAHRYNKDTRDGGRGKRNESTGASVGAFRCHFAAECSKVCPKGVDPAKAIQHLKRQLVFDFLHLTRKQKPCDKLEGQCKGEKDPSIPPAPPYTV
jgi:succinate dehydrogenase / fumarate reductase, iron-sulfur subunit